ncbi:MAG: JAB domain-containing protein [Pontixanthobacter sp.]
MLLAARDLVDTARQEQLSSASVDPNDPSLRQYLQSRLGTGTQERLLVIFCDHAKQYLLDEEMGWGTSGNVRFNMVKLFRRSLELDAACLLLVHNHPSGQCLPSDDDIDSTRRLAATAQALGLTILDHLIVTQRQCYSLRAGALL